MRRLVLLSAACHFLVFIFVVWARIRYPFELEWIEGGTLDHVRHILAGHLLYAQPSIEFTAFIYTPLYYYAAAAASLWLGPGFTALRIVSFLSSLGCIALIIDSVRHRTRDWFAGCVAGGLFVATFHICGTWFDLARVDMLAVFLLLAAFALCRRSNGATASVLTSALLVLAVFAKQSVLVAAIAIVLQTRWTNRRSLVITAASFVTFLTAAVLTLNVVHQGWFWFYTVHLPANHPLRWAEAIGFWGSDLALPLGIACLFAITGLALSRDRATALVLAGAIAGSLFGRLHEGGYFNVDIPTYAILAITFGFALPQLVNRLPARVVLGGCLLQFAALAYNPLHVIPSAADRGAAEEFIKTIAEYPGDVLVMHHGAYSQLAGKPAFAHSFAIDDVLRGDKGPVSARLLSDIASAVHERRWVEIVSDLESCDGLPPVRWLPADFSQYYAPTHQLCFKDDVFWPVATRLRRPRVIFTSIGTPASPVR